MSDIHCCISCNESVYMDNAERCIVCGDWFCGGCDYENGEKLWSENNANYYYACKDCLDNGIEYVNDENMDEAIFLEDEYKRAVKELNARIY